MSARALARDRGWCTARFTHLGEKEMESAGVPAAGGRRTRLWIGAGLALAVVAVLAVLTAGGSADRPDPAARPEAMPSTQAARPGQDELPAGLARRKPNDPLALGRVDAPVVLIEWAEFQCPFCGRFARDTQPTLVKKYVDTGKVRIEWRDFPYLGPESTTAARAGRAAAQGKFWQYHDALYHHQFPVNSGKLTEDHLVRLAGTLGMDTTSFRNEMNSPQTAKIVQADMQQGISLGITGTPAFLIGQTPMMGAQPEAAFERAIDDALRKAR
jgi:protein-disulfide isomerase